MASREVPVTWVVLTGEYPPQRGGVSDYTRTVARGLAAAGDSVHVWAPACEGSPASDPGVTVHRCAGFGPRALAQVGAAIDSLPEPRRLLVQWVPHAFGWRAMNLPFCVWVASVRREPLFVMFHEVAFPWTVFPLRHSLLALATRAASATLGRAATRIFVSVPAWARVLRTLPIGRGRTVSWLPVPSNLPTRVDHEAARSLHARLRLPETSIIGHFGTYGQEIAPVLEGVLDELLRRSESRVALLLGRGSARFALSAVARRGLPRDRLLAPDVDEPEAIASLLARCDAVVQPYVDGISTRRTTAMASLALGVPILTNSGPLTESIWTERDAVRLVSRFDVEALANAAEALLAGPADARTQLGARGARLYEDRFALAHTVRTLRSAT